MGEVHGITDGTVKLVKGHGVVKDQRQPPDGRVFVYRDSLKLWGTICKSNSYTTAAVACRAVSSCADTCEDPACVLVPKKIGYAKFWEPIIPDKSPHPDAPIWGSSISCPNVCNLKTIAWLEDTGTQLIKWDEVGTQCTPWAATATDARNWGRDEKGYMMCNHEEDLWVSCGVQDASLLHHRHQLLRLPVLPPPH